MDEYSEMVAVAKPVVYITAGELVATHRVRGASGARRPLEGLRACGDVMLRDALSRGEAVGRGWARWESPPPRDQRVPPHVPAVPADGVTQLLRLEETSEIVLCVPVMGGARVGPEVLGGFSNLGDPRSEQGWADGGASLSRSRAAARRPSVPRCHPASSSQQGCTAPLDPIVFPTADRSPLLRPNPPSAAPFPNPLTSRT